MNNIAIILTVFNRKAKTLRCMSQIQEALDKQAIPFQLHVYLTDDGSTDGTADALAEQNYTFPLTILKGTGSLYWNGGMINSWKAALDAPENYDGYLWLNDDAEIALSFWEELLKGDNHCRSKYGQPAILVGSTTDLAGKEFTYGGFNFSNPITLKDVFVIPDRKTYQECQCAHGNITYIPANVVEKMGIFTDKYIHGGSDHDYTYLAYKNGFKVIVLPQYAGRCDNDHGSQSTLGFNAPTIKERLAYLHAPLGYNLNNALLFQKRCFPYRYPFVFIMGYAKALFPKVFTTLYHWLRR